MELKTFKTDHAFGTLSGSDNMVCFTTKRYNSTPLVIRGPGAGAEVGSLDSSLKLPHTLPRSSSQLPHTRCALSHR